jgi:hypothetical protein
MVVAGTVGAGDSMADFRVMAGSLRRVGSRMRVVMVVGIVLDMAAVECMRRSMEGGSWVVERVWGLPEQGCCVGGRGFITAEEIGGVGMGFRMGMVWAMTGWIMAGSMQMIRGMAVRMTPAMDTMARTT